MKRIPARIQSACGRFTTVLALAALAGPAAAGTVEGHLTIGSGYLDNPIGLSREPAAGYVTESLRLNTAFGGETATPAFKLGYEGSASQFSNEVSLGSVRHGLGLEWFRGAGAGGARLSAGVQGAVRTYQDAYRVYDHREVNVYLAGKRPLTAGSLLRGFVATRWRLYGDLPEESYVEPSGQLEFQKFFASRLTTGLSLRLGAKYFNDSVAPSVWGTTDLPSTSQLAARLNLAKGFSDRLAWRGWVESRRLLSGFPHYVSGDIYDSPLLDVYAHEGTDGFSALKVLGPWQTWWEAGASLGDHDYGELLFASAAGGRIRRDTVREYYVAADRIFNGGGARPRLRLAVGWRDQSSSLDEYTYAGVFASSSLSLQF